MNKGIGILYLEYLLFTAAVSFAPTFLYKRYQATVSLSCRSLPLSPSVTVRKSQMSAVGGVLTQCNRSL